MLSFFPLGVLDEIWDLIESVSEGFLTYFCILTPENGLFAKTLKLRKIIAYIFVRIYKFMRSQSLNG